YAETPPPNRSASPERPEADEAEDDREHEPERALEGRPDLVVAREAFVRLVGATAAHRSPLPRQLDSLSLSQPLLSDKGPSSYKSASTAENAGTRAPSSSAEFFRKIPGSSHAADSSTAR